jgi:hypothetical protein
MPKSTEKSEIEFIRATCREFGVKPELGERLYLHNKQHFQPPVVRSEAKILQAFFERLVERLSALEEDADVDVDKLMLEEGMDPKVRSDRQRTQKFLKDSGMMVQLPGTQARWVKRMTNKPNGGRD